MTEGNLTTVQNPPNCTSTQGDTPAARVHYLVTLKTPNNKKIAIEGTRGFIMDYLLKLFYPSGIRPLSEGKSHGLHSGQQRNRRRALPDTHQ